MQIKELLEYQNACFKAYKQKLGIQYAWAPNQSGYVAPEIRLLGFAEEYAKEIPDYIRISE